MGIVNLFKTDAVDVTGLEARFAAGQMSAMEEIMALYERSIYHLGLRLFSCREAAADFCHDVFIRCYEKRHRFNPAKPLKPWLFQVAVNLGRDRLRRHRETSLDDQHIHEPAVASQADHQLEKEELKKKVWQAMAMVRPIYREILALRFSSTMSVKEIAQSLNISLSAAKVRLCRGLNAFETAFKEIGGEADVL